MKALMLGVGHFPPERKIVPIGAPEVQVDWTTLDINRDVKADIYYDLDELEHGARLPLDDESFDEIHAYQVLEHFGRQGDFRGFFLTFREFWRVLKPGGELYGDTPALHSRWLWGDPGHCRVVTMESLSFLTRRAYAELGKTTSTDYRRLVDPYWWIILHSAEEGDRHGFVLRKSS